MRNLRVHQIISASGEIGGFAMRIAYTGLAFVLSILVARLLGVDGVGRYYSALAWVLVAGTFAQSGWNTYLVRQVFLLRRDGRGHLAWTVRAAIRTAAFTALSVTIVTAIGGAVTINDDSFALLLLGMPAILLLGWSAVGDAVLRGFDRPLLSLVSEYLVRPGVQILGLLVCMVFSIPVTPLAAMTVFLLAVIAGSILTFVFARRFLIPYRGIVQDQESDRRWVKPFARTAILGCLIALNLQIGTLLLARLSIDGDVARFRIAQQLSLLLPFGLAVVSSLYFTRFADHYRNGDNRALSRLIIRASTVALAIAVPLALVFAFKAQSLITLLYGVGFIGAVTPLLLLSIGQVINAGLGIASTVAIAIHSEGTALAAQCIGLAVNILICVILIPSMGVTGAAIGSMTTTIFVNLWLILSLRSRITFCIR